MALFKNNPERAVQSEIDAATANRERLSTKLVESEQGVARHAGAAKQAALTGDDAELDRAEASLRAAQDRSATLKTALTEVDQQLEGLERTKAEIADRKLRAQTAAEIELLVRNMADVSAEYDAAAARLAELTARAVPLLWEARGLDDFINVGRAQVPPAIDNVAHLLRAHADDVIAGKAPATLRRPDAPASKAKSTARDVAPDPVLVAANFQPLDRGPARTLKVTP
jgi:hypothetical protein